MSMKIQIKQPDLRRIVEIAASAITGKSTLPILSHIHIAIDPKKKTMRATGTNLELWAEATAPLVDSSELEFEDDAENGEVIATASARQFLALVLSLPSSSTVTIDFDTRGLTRRDLVISAATTRSKLPGLPWEEFPLPPDVDTKACVTIPASHLISLVDYVVGSVARDQTRPILTGVYFEIGEGTIKSVATDTHRLSVRCLPVNHSGNITAVVPAPPLLSFLGVVRKAAKDAPIQMELTTGQGRFTLEDTKYTIRLIEGQYPNYARVIPTDFDREIVVDRQEFMDAINRAMIAAADDANRVTLETEEGENTLSVSGQSHSSGEVSSTIEIGFLGQPIQIAGHGLYFQTALKAFECDGVKIQMNDPLRPMLFTGSGDGALPQEEALTVVMPMQVV